MQVEDFLRLINEIEFICDDIDDIQDQVDLTKFETKKLCEAVASMEKAKQILAELFPKIRSLDSKVREDLKSEIHAVE